MNPLEDLVLECSDYRGDMSDYIAYICYEINKLKANYPEEDFYNLTNKITLLINFCDTVLLDNESKSNKLDSTLSELADLSCKLSLEKKQRETELNHSCYVQEAECKEKTALKKQINEINAKLKDMVSKYDSVLLENNVLSKKIKKIRTQVKGELEKNAIKDKSIDNLKFNLDMVTNDYSNLMAKRCWDKDKWLEDTALNDYFCAFADGMGRSDIIFYGPSLTLAIKFSTGNAVDSLNLTSYPSSKYVFLCISDCKDASKDDGGSHWSLLVVEICRNKAYHFDSMQPLNGNSARVVANNLGIPSEDVAEVPCTQQKNSYECGIHVLANAKYIANHYCNGNDSIPLIDWLKKSNSNGSIHDNGKDHVIAISTTNRKIAKTNNPLPKSSMWQNTRKRKTLAGKINNIKIREAGIALTNRFEVLDVIGGKEDTINQEDDSSSTIEVYNKCNSSNNKNRTIPKLIKNNNTTSFTTYNKHKLRLMCDSQGRQLSAHLEHINNSKYSILNHCYPGAPLQQILDLTVSMAEFHKLTKQDFVVVIGGTNNISQQTVLDQLSTLNVLKDVLECKIALCRHTNVILATVPYRYDLHEMSRANQLIRDINSMIRNVTYNEPHVHLLDLHLLQSSHHTKHGLHINRKGKKFISREIMKLVEHTKPEHEVLIIGQENANMSNAKIVTLSESAKSSIGSEKPFSNMANTSIEITEANMADVIEGAKYCPDVAFAHCISGDLDDQRNMTAGVAATFRKIFGRPKKSECINNYLTLQKAKDQCAVYGLVTKSKFSGKPTVEDYSEAFNHLIQDFKYRGFKRLVCSPLGCMRDQILPQLFVKHLVRFQHLTSASVSIIVYNERASRTLRNGLEHEDFVELLRRCISEEQRSSQAACHSMGRSTPIPVTHLQTHQEHFLG